MRLAPCYEILPNENISFIDVLVFIKLTFSKCFFLHQFLIRISWEANIANVSHIYLFLFFSKSVFKLRQKIVVFTGVNQRQNNDNRARRDQHYTNQENIFGFDVLISSID